MTDAGNQPPESIMSMVVIFAIAADVADVTSGPDVICVSPENWIHPKSRRPKADEELCAYTTFGCILACGWTMVGMAQVVEAHWSAEASAGMGWPTLAAMTLCVIPGMVARRLMLPPLRRRLGIPEWHGTETGGGWGNDDGG